MIFNTFIFFISILLLSSLHSYAVESPKKVTVTKVIKKSDPLGQQARLKGSIPKTNNNSEFEISISRKEIMIIQLILEQEGYYSGSINGTLDPHTKNAINNYKKINNLLSNKLLDSKTLISFGLF